MLYRNWVIFPRVDWASLARWIYPKASRLWLNIFAMSVCVHLVLLVCMLLLPYPDSKNVITSIAFPVMLIYPIATVLLSLLLIRQQMLKQTQVQLKQSEERFKLLFDKAPLGYQSLDADGYFIEVNQQWCDLLGYTREEVINEWLETSFLRITKKLFVSVFQYSKHKGLSTANLKFFINQACHCLSRLKEE